MIGRSAHVAELTRLFRSHPVVAILGPRQVGKTTLARVFAAARRGEAHRFDLENPDDVSRLSEPMLALDRLAGLVIIDEIQRRPDLFQALRVLVDRPQSRARFLVLGSASPDLLRQSSETLAGRIAYHQLGGFSLGEVGVGRRARLWQRGGFPRSYLARTEGDSYEWRSQFVGTFLERDIPLLGLRLPAASLRRFWAMLAHYHGRTWNASELARSFGLSDTAVRGYLDALQGTFMVRLLQPWSENLGKRQVKAPKVYLADSGLLHVLLGIRDAAQLDVHPKVGASFEGFALHELATHLGADPAECFFWATYQGAELDLLVVRGRRRRGFEFKLTTSPAVTKSTRIALQDLRLDGIDVVHAGSRTFPLAEGIRAVSIDRMLSDIRP
ncbi:MAG TPA: ATP-binding protein [Anaeromyxobacteraceae bacterium]|nr:ATP-binding protein [Anaeromyxobacteraceae bacterium]